jgi:hypothetical protein
MLAGQPRSHPHIGGDGLSVSQLPQTPVVIIRPTGGVQCPESWCCRDPALDSRRVPDPLLLP